MTRSPISFTFAEMLSPPQRDCLCPRAAHVHHCRPELLKLTVPADQENLHCGLADQGKLLILHDGTVLACNGRRQFLQELVP
jgi:hypothetical protein